MGGGDIQSRAMECVGGCQSEVKMTEEGMMIRDMRDTTLIESYLGTWVAMRA